MKNKNVLMIPLNAVSSDHQNAFMGKEKIRDINMIDVWTLTNDILSGSVYDAEAWKPYHEKIEKLYCTLASYVGSISEYDNTSSHALNQELESAEDFYGMTKELSEHFYTDIYKIDTMMPALTALSLADWDNEYYDTKSRLVAMYVALYIQATLNVEGKGVLLPENE
jgi:hypothetical protein